SPQSSSEASIAVALAPPFYQTNWFLACSVLLLAAGVWVAIRLYGEQTRQRYAVMLAERTRLAREMHDTVIQDCVGISTLLEAASTVPSDSSTMREFLDRARTQMRLTLDDARQAVWDLRNASPDRCATEALVDF